MITRFLVLLLLIPLSGCLAVAGTGGVLAAQDRPVEEGVTDISAGQAVRNGLALDREHDFSFVRVRAAEGTVLLVGAVATPEAKQVAEKIAYDRTHSRRIENALEISTTAASRPMDSWLAGQARAALTGDAYVRSINFAIEVYDGVVYLLGRARTREELGRAAEILARVRGVQRVVVLADVKPY